jgi:soluble cytochrome b562
MKADKIHKQQMLERVFNFGQTHLGLFPEGSAAGEIIASLGSAIGKLSGKASQQVSVAGDIRESAVSRQDARKALKWRLDLIDQTARALKLDQFYMPRNKTDAAYIAAGQAFAQQAQPLKKDFIKQGVPADFIEALNAAVTDLQQATLDQTSSKGEHSSSIADFNETLKQAMSELKRFDALVKNCLGGNPGIMAAWKIARRIGRPSAAKAATAAAASVV